VVEEERDRRMTMVDMGGGDEMLGGLRKHECHCNWW